MGSGSDTQQITQLNHVALVTITLTRVLSVSLSFFYSQLQKYKQIKLSAKVPVDQLQHILIV